MRNLGMVVLSSYSGLGNQSRRLTQMLQPEKILLIDSTSFSRNKEQHPEWYQGFNGYVSQGFPTNKTVNLFLQGLTHLYLIENPLNWQLIREATRLGIKSYIASNPEFCDNLRDKSLPLPDCFLMPSKWMMTDMKMNFGTDRVKYLPPPTDPNEFKDARSVNFERKDRRRFLHVVGTLAAADRNGTLSLLSALQYCKEDFELVIKSQHPLPPEYIKDDRRISYKIDNAREVQDLYRDFDAMILPRRFGGLCLPMNEALMAGLPVIMTDISPNSDVLPKEWLVESRCGPGDVIVTRTPINLYTADHHKLAEKIDQFATMDLERYKVDAFSLAHANYSPSALREAYEKLW